MFEEEIEIEKPSFGKCNGKANMSIKWRMNQFGLTFDLEQNKEEENFLFLIQQLLRPFVQWEGDDEPAKCSDIFYDDEGRARKVPDWLKQEIDGFFEGRWKNVQLKDFLKYVFSEKEKILKDESSIVSCETCYEQNKKENENDSVCMQCIENRFGRFSNNSWIYLKYVFSLPGRKGRGTRTILEESRKDLDSFVIGKLEEYRLFLLSEKNEEKEKK